MSPFFEEDYKLYLSLRALRESNTYGTELCDVCQIQVAILWQVVVQYSPHEDDGKEHVCTYERVVSRFCDMRTSYIGDGKVE